MKVRQTKVLSGAVRLDLPAAVGHCGFVDETNDLVTDGLFAQLVIADRLDAVVDRLAGQVCLQRTEEARAGLASYLYAHTQLARALRERVAGEHAESAGLLHAASRLLECVAVTDFVIG